MQDMSDNGQDTTENAPESTRTGPVFVPPTDIIETKESLLMLLDMPGADPETLDVSLDQRVLSISARSTPTTPEGYAPIYTEFRDGAYERKFMVSDQVDRERIDAVLKDGVLRITMPKAAPSPAKKISVKLH